MSANVAISLNLGQPFAGFQGGVASNQRTGEATSLLRTPFGGNFQDKVGLNFVTTLSAGATALGTLATTALGLNETFKGWVDRFGKFSPIVARAQAQEQVRDIMREVRIGREQGTELADMVHAQAELNRSLDEIKIQILKPLLPMITDLVRGLNLVAGALGPAIEKIYGGLKDANTAAVNASASTLIWLAKMTGYTKELKEFADNWTRKQNLKGMEEMEIEAFLDPARFGNLGLGPAAGSGGRPAVQEDWVPAS